MAEDQQIIIVAKDEQFRQGMRALLEGEDYVIHARESIERVVQFLAVKKADMIVTDYVLSDGNAFKLLEQVRNEKNFYSDIPIFVIGEETNADTCVAALEQGASDYCDKPIKRKVFLARFNKILREIRRQKENPVTLELKLEPSEIPGMLQLLETEGKSGLLKVSSDKEYGDFYFKTGMLIHAETEYCSGKDALIDLLSWPFVQMRFIAKAVNEEDFSESDSMRASSAMMDCVFEVDEYREILKKYSDPEMTFNPGQKTLPKNANKAATILHRFASNGSSLEKLLHTVKMNKRHLIRLLDQLVSSNYLDISEAPFHDYWKQMGLWYSRQHDELNKFLPDVFDGLNDLHYPLLKSYKELDFETNYSPMGVVPRILIASDKPLHSEVFFETLLAIGGNSVGKKSPSKFGQKHDQQSRVYFENDAQVDIQTLSPRLDPIYLEKVFSQPAPVISLIYLSAGLDTEQARESRMQLRSLRNAFKGQCLIVTPIRSDEEPEFKVSCDYCAHVLSVDMDLEGSEGECPVCATPVNVPPIYQRSHKMLRLPSEVGTCVIDPTNGEDVRNLLNFSMITLIESLAVPVEA